MYHMYILKNDQFPDLIHDHVDLDVHLDPQDGLDCLQNHKIRIPLEWAINMCIVPLLLELRISLFLAGYHGVAWRWRLNFFKTEIPILLEKLAYKLACALSFGVQWFRILMGGGVGIDPPVRNKLQNHLPGIKNYFTPIWLGQNNERLRGELPSASFGFIWVQTFIILNMITVRNNYPDLYRILMISQPLFYLNIIVVKKYP